MKEISKEFFIENIEDLDIKEPYKIKDEGLVIIPFDEYERILKIIDPEKLKEIKEALKQVKE